MQESETIAILTVFLEGKQLLGGEDERFKSESVQDGVMVDSSKCDRDVVE